MKGLIDGLLLFLNSGQIGDYQRGYIDNLLKYKNFDLKIIKDYEITSNKYNNYAIDLFIDRKNDNYSNLIKYIKQNNIDFYHCLNNGFSIPKEYDFNYVMSITNLLPLFYEDYCNLNYNNNFFNKFPYSVMKSNFIVCPSMSCKKDFLRNFSVDEKNIFVNYGFSSNLFSKIDKFMSEVYIKSKFGIDFEFIIFYGDFNKRKNLHNTIKFFYELRSLIPKLHFIISTDVFGDLNYYDSLKDLSSRLQISNYVHFIDNLNIYDRVNLFSSALCFIDLSLYECLNINIIDAFKCEVPIVCSNINLYREYLGDYAFYYDFNCEMKCVIDYIYNYVYISNNYTLSKFDNYLNNKVLTNIYNSILGWEGNYE